jgi:3-isopropylmalate/(R)-2-methylmalate dehydratase small subunit
MMRSLNQTISGKVYVLGPNVDTDQIIPAEHLVYSLTDAEESKKYGQYALSGVPVHRAGLPSGMIPFINTDETQSIFKIIISGPNFGCGSSREHAPFALQQAGVRAIVAESFARIFYRNAVDGGFVIPLESSVPLTDVFATSMNAEIDLKNYSLKNVDSGETYDLKPPGDILPIIEAGGIFAYARKTGLI